jgi:hypothetical protein
MKSIFLFLLAVSLAGALIWMGCSEDNNNSASGDPGQIRIIMVDDPAQEFEHVYIEILSVEVHRADADSNSGWIEVSSNPGIYDLLLLVNGIDTVLADTALAPGHYTQIRLYLGDDNSVVVAGQSYPLEIPSAQQSGLKLNHEFWIESNVLYDLTLEFDAEDEIHQTGNGQYMMNPVIRVQATAVSGTIDGTVVPVAAYPRIWTIAGTDTVSTYANFISGYFKLMALPAGLYHVHINPTAGSWQDTTIFNVPVLAQQNTGLDTITLTP